MPIYYLDTSALVKRYVLASGSRWVDALVDPAAGNRILTAELARVEVAAALAARHRAPAALGLPLLDRDALKVGLVTTHGIETDELRQSIVPGWFDIFYQTIAAWLRAGVSLSAEHSFRRGMSASAPRPLTRLASARVLHCDTADQKAQRRFPARTRQRGDSAGTACGYQRPHDAGNVRSGGIRRSRPRCSPAARRHDRWLCARARRHFRLLLERQVDG